MLYLLLSVSCSVLVSVLLKVFQRVRVDPAQAITWNYLMASLLCFVFLRPSLALLQSAQTPWFALLGLAIMLPSLFLVLAQSVREAGIVRTDIAQRLSLLLSLGAAFFWFGEETSPRKLVGVAIGLLAVFGILARSEPHSQPASQPGTTQAPSAAPSSTSTQASLWLALVWLGYAVVDVLLKTIALAGTQTTSALTVTFSVAFLMMLLFHLQRQLRGVAALTLRSVGWGLLLGLLNFGNIMFYIMAHRAFPGSPAIVFATMNVGVVALGSLVGIWIFHEPTSRINRASIGLAIVAIFVIASSGL